MAETPSSPEIFNYEISGIRDCSIEKTLEGTSCSAIPGPRDFSALMCSKSSTGYIQTTVRTDPPRARQRQGLEFSRLLNTSGDPVCPLISADLVRGNARASRLFSSALMCSKCSTGYIQTTVRIDPPRARQRQGLEVSRPRRPSARPRARQRQGLEIF